MGWLASACLLRHYRVVEMKERLTTQIRADFDKSFTTGGAGVRYSTLVLWHGLCLGYVRTYVRTSVEVQSIEVQLLCL